MKIMILELLSLFAHWTYARTPKQPSALGNVISTRIQEGECSEQFPPTAFSLDSIQYIKVEYALYTPDLHGPNSTQMAFEVVNEANNVSTGCTFMRVMMEGGQYPDDSKDWHPCEDRSIDVNDQEVVVGTTAQFDWDTWSLAVNQSWTCGDGYAIRLKRV